MHCRYSRNLMDYMQESHWNENDHYLGYCCWDNILVIVGIAMVGKQGGNSIMVGLIAGR